MRKMKSALYISVIAALFLASCTERLPEPQVPDIQNDYTTVISASVNPLSIEGISAAGEFAWNESHTMGVSGSEMGKNELYVPVKSTIGTSEALFYGGAVKGEFAIYAPYHNRAFGTVRSSQVPPHHQSALAACGPDKTQYLLRDCPVHPL